MRLCLRNVELSLEWVVTFGHIADAASDAGAQCKWGLNWRVRIACNKYRIFSRRLHGNSTTSCWNSCFVQNHGMFVVLVTIVIKATILLLIILKKDTFCTIIYIQFVQVFLSEELECAWIWYITFSKYTHTPAVSFRAQIYKIDGNSFVILFLPSAWHITTRFYRIISKQRTTHKYGVCCDFGGERKTMVLSLNVNAEGRNGFPIETIFSVRYLAMIRYMWRFVCSCFDCLLFSSST